MICDVIITSVVVMFAIPLHSNGTVIQEVQRLRVRKREIETVKNFVIRSDNIENWKLQDLNRNKLLQNITFQAIFNKTMFLMIDFKHIFKLSLNF